MTIWAPLARMRGAHPPRPNISRHVVNKCSITGTYRALRKKHMVRYLAESEWRFNHRFDLAAMIPALARAAVATKPQPYWWLKMADYGA